MTERSRDYLAKLLKKNIEKKKISKLEIPYQMIFKWFVCFESKGYWVILDIVFFKGIKEKVLCCHNKNKKVPVKLKNKVLKKFYKKYTREK